MTRLEFIFSEILIGLRRNLMMALSLVLVTMVSLSLVGGGILAQKQVDTMKDYWYDRVQVSIFLCGQDSDAPTCSGVVTQAQKDQIQTDLDSAQLKPYIEKVYYESKKEAFNRFREQFKDNALSDSVTEDVMPESYRVRLKNPEEYQVVSQLFEDRPGVEQVETQNKVLDRLFALFNGGKWAAWLIAMVTLVCSALNVAVTIRLTAFTRRRETGIMRLVGASNLVIQLPFILESVIAALVGAILASVLLVVATKFVVLNWLKDNLGFVDYVQMGDVVAVIPWLFLIAIVLAGVSSYLSLLRYLRV
jgi:cell division transport system permease protein